MYKEPYLDLKLFEYISSKWFHLCTVHIYLIFLHYILARHYSDIWWKEGKICNCGYVNPQEIDECKFACVGWWVCYVYTSGGLIIGGIKLLS